MHDLRRAVHVHTVWIPQCALGGDSVVGSKTRIYSDAQRELLFCCQALSPSPLHFLLIYSSSRPLPLSSPAPLPPSLSLSPALSSSLSSSLRPSSSLSSEWPRRGSSYSFKSTRSSMFTIIPPSSCQPSSCRHVTLPDRCVAFLPSLPLSPPLSLSLHACNIFFPAPVLNWQSVRMLLLSHCPLFVMACSS